jgi:hypothetical protein
VQHEVAAVIVAMDTARAVPTRAPRRSRDTPRSAVDAPGSAAPRYASRKCFVKNCSSHVSFSTSNAMRYGTYSTRPARSRGAERFDQADRLPIQRAMFAG